MYVMIKKFKTIGLLCAVMICVCVPQMVLAERIGIAVDQTNIAFDADAEETQEFSVKITNISEKKQNVSIGAMDYTIGENNELLLDREFDEKDGVKDWITAKEPNITLEPNESRDVVFYFVAPATAPVGSHRGAVVFRVLPEKGEDVSVQGQVAVHTLVNIKGDTHASGRVNFFDIPLFPLNNPIVYMAEFENTGNIHYVPYGEVVITNIFTKSVHVQKYEKHFIFPGKKYDFSFTENIPSIFGVYRAQVNFVDGEGVVRSRNDYTVGYLFPLVLIIIIIGCLILIRWLLGKKKLNTHSRLDYQQKKRNTFKLQDLLRKKDHKPIIKENTEL